MERYQKLQSKNFQKHRAKEKTSMERDREVQDGHSITPEVQDQSTPMTFQGPVIHEQIEDVSPGMSGSDNNSVPFGAKPNNIDPSRHKQEDNFSDPVDTPPRKQGDNHSDHVSSP